MELLEHLDTTVLYRKKELTPGGKGDRKRITTCTHPQGLSMYFQSVAAFQLLLKEFPNTCHKPDCQFGTMFSLKQLVITVLG